MNVWFWLIVVSLAAATPAYSQAFTIEYDTDRMYGDYKDFDLPEANYILCQNACANDANCKAFTYVKPGVQAARARCWLKNSVPSGYANTNCITGLKKATNTGFSGANWRAYGWEFIRIEQNGSNITGAYSAYADRRSNAGNLVGVMRGDSYYFSWTGDDGSTGEAYLYPFDSGRRWGLRSCKGRGCDAVNGSGYSEAYKL